MFKSVTALKLSKDTTYRQTDTAFYSVGWLFYWNSCLGNRKSRVSGQSLREWQSQSSRTSLWARALFKSPGKFKNLSIITSFNKYLSDYEHWELSPDSNSDGNSVWRSLTCHSGKWSFAEKLHKNHLWPLFSFWSSRVLTGRCSREIWLPDSPLTSH